MELIFVRHALPVREVREDGPADPGLGPVGVQQATAVAGWLAHETIDAIARARRDARSKPRHRSFGDWAWPR